MSDPTLSMLLDILACTDPASVREESGDEHRLSWFIASWCEAGFPGIPQGTPISGECADVLCMIEVLPRYRSSRGRFWRPNGNGYTNDPAKAGLYTADEARRTVAGSERIRAVLPVGS